MQEQANNREKEVTLRQPVGRRTQAVGKCLSKMPRPVKEQWCQFDSDKSFVSPKNLQILSAKYSAQVQISGFTCLWQFLMVLKKCKLKIKIQIGLHFKLCSKYMWINALSFKYFRRLIHKSIPVCLFLSFHKITRMDNNNDDSNNSKN